MATLSYQHDMDLRKVIQAPTPRVKRQWLQFGLLRFLLWVLGLSLIFPWLGREHRRGEFVEKFRKLGTVEFDASATPGYTIRSILHHLVGDRIGGDVNRIDLRYAYVNDDDMVGVELMPELKFLDITHTSVGDAGVARFCGLKKLRELHIGGQYAWRITDQGIGQLGKLRELRVLSLRKTGITGPGLAALCGYEKT